MTPTTAVVAFSLISTAPLFGQTAGDALAAGRDKLAKALAKAAATVDTSFCAEWSVASPKAKADPIAVFLTNKAGSAAAGKVQGSWHDGLVHVTSDAPAKDELLVAGRRQLAKDKDTDWVLRSGRHADGSDSGYVPDVALLLQQLATWNLAIVNRSVGSLDDRPIEIYSVTLDPDQVTAAAWADLVPDALITAANPLAQIVRFQAAGAGAAARPAVPKPQATVDLAIFVDPSTSTVHKLHFRSWSKSDPRMAGMAGGALVVRGGAFQVLNAGDDEENEETAEQDENAPLQFVDGLPQRPTDKMTVRDYVVELSGHGQTAAPALTDAQRRLLGLVR